MRMGRGTMSIIDRQRIAAVRAMEAMGYTFDGISWIAPASAAAILMPDLVAEADVLHSLLVLRADKLSSCGEGSEEETELQLIADSVMAYEDKRWPDGKVPGGKG
jgi:hypothetical protein